MLNPSFPLQDLIERESRSYFSYSLKEQQFLYKNKSFEAFLAEHASPDLTQLLLLIHDEDREYVRKVYQSLGRGHVAERIEFRLVMEQRTYYLNLTAVITAEKPRCLIGHFEDVTEEIIHTKNLIEYTNKKNAVLNIISHDLAGPLGTIQMLSALLQGKASSLNTDKLQKILVMIETNAKRGIKMIQEFIKKEFLESVGVDVQKQRINIVKGLEEIIAEYKSSELHIHLHFEFNCPFSEIFVMIDPTKFYQAINNLISNAIKFTPDKGTISINISRKANKVIVEIADTGIGIPKKFHDKLFDKFNVAGRTGLKGESSVGLGMSIIKTIIKWHNGKIWFTSEENKGTNFFIELDECD